MVKVKICGITKQEDLIAAITAGADSLGFIIDVPSSKRNLSLAQAKKLISKVPKNIYTIGVTTFKDMQTLTHLLKRLNTDYIQIHGDLNYFLKSHTHSSLRNQLIGSVNANSSNSLKLAVEYSHIFNSILLDTADYEGLGGTGKSHNWNLSRRIKDRIYPTPLILAGGLTPKNIREAIQIVDPYGVDVSSGVEKEPGIKDHEKIHDFIRRAKEAKY
jgi:phosphoribosylanthranilate isomerase